MFLIYVSLLGFPVFVPLVLCSFSFLGVRKMVRPLRAGFLLLQAMLPPISSTFFIGQGMIPDHAWDFRACTDGVPVADAYSALEATLLDGALCSAQGVMLNGSGAHVSLNPWRKGATMTIELLVKGYNARPDGRRGAR